MRDPPAPRPDPGDAILVALTFDLDPDSFDSSIDAHRTDRMTWRGIEEGVPAILDVLDRVGAQAGRRPKATWVNSAMSLVSSMHHE